MSYVTILFNHMNAFSYNAVLFVFITNTKCLRGLLHRAQPLSVSSGRTLDCYPSSQSFCSGCTEHQCVLHHVFLHPGIVWSATVNVGTSPNSAMAMFWANHDFSAAVDICETCVCPREQPINQESPPLHSCAGQTPIWTF